MTRINHALTRHIEQRNALRRRAQKRYLTQIEERVRLREAKNERSQHDTHPAGDTPERP